MIAVDVPTTCKGCTEPISVGGEWRESVANLRSLLNRYAPETAAASKHAFPVNLSKEVTMVRSDDGSLTYQAPYFKDTVDAPALHRCYLTVADALWLCEVLELELGVVCNNQRTGCAKGGENGIYS